MSYIHIIVLFEIFIFLIALYFIMKMHMKNSRISKEKDFIAKNEKDNKINKETELKLKLKVLDSFFLENNLEE